MGTSTKIQKISSFYSHPDTYRHFKLEIDGSVASLILKIDENNGLRPDDYELKLNSYDMGVDLELHDAVERIRFEHPQVRTVLITSGLARVFCAGANIKMLASSSHGFKVNFCKYTNETRCGIEEATLQSGQTYVAALNGTASGGGYELALACDKIYLIDDGNAAVSLPEVPLLGVLPGTGGLTRLVDKRMVRRDIADIFCTKAEGFRARQAVKMDLVDGSFSRSKWGEGIAKVAADIASNHPARSTEGVKLGCVDPTHSEDGTSFSYEYVNVELDKKSRTANITILGPNSSAPANIAALLSEGADTWGFKMYRELEDALLRLRFNHSTIGLLLFHAKGDKEAILAHDKVLHDAKGDWFADELIWYRGRVLRRIDNMAKSMFAIIGEESSFVGTLFEITLSCDRSYMMEDDDELVTVQINASSGGLYPMSTGITRLLCRFMGNPASVNTALEHGGSLHASAANELDLVTMSLDDIDWEDEIRIAVEERVSLSPDALTGMEQNLRFVGAENCETKIYGRLTAWQNWIFQRPNAVGEKGALTLYGHPQRPSFDWNRT